MANNFASFRREEGRKILQRGPRCWGSLGWVYARSLRFEYQKRYFRDGESKGCELSRPLWPRRVAFDGRATSYIKGQDADQYPPCTFDLFLLLSFSRFWKTSSVNPERKKEREIRVGVREVVFLAGWVIELFYLLNKGIDLVGIKFFRSLIDVLLCFVELWYFSFFFFFFRFIGKIRGNIRW